MKYTIHGLFGLVRPFWDPETNVRKVKHLKNGCDWKWRKFHFWGFRPAYFQVLCRIFFSDSIHSPNISST